MKSEEAEKNRTEGGERSETQKKYSPPLWPIFTLQQTRREDLDFGQPHGTAGTLTRSEGSLSRVESFHEEALKARSEKRRDCHVRWLGNVAEVKRKNHTIT
jgi:hypothetical protein